MGPDAGTRPPLRQQGRDFLQAASNMASDVVAAPVDLISMGLRAAGVPVPENAVGGTQWQTERGLRREVPMGAARVLGETAGMASPTALFAKAPQVASALNQAGRNLGAPGGTMTRGMAGRQRGAINYPGAPKYLYHGSAEPFDVFDSRKLGSNTRADDALVGHHFAESRADADFYAMMAARNAEKRGSLNQEWPEGWIGRFDLEMKKPLIVSESSGLQKHIVEKMLQDKRFAADFAQRNGFDGIVYPQGTNVDAGYTAISFDPAKIKRLPDW